MITLYAAQKDLREVDSNIFATFLFVLLFLNKYDT